MSNFSLTSIDVTGLRIFSNERDVLRDLFIFMEYMGERRIKRMTRTNEIPRSDQQRLAKLLGGLPVEGDQGDSEASQWIEFIDQLAYRLHLVSYDIKGEYRGASSTEPSFIENYISVNAAQLREFLELSPVKQEKKILGTLKAPHSLSTYSDTAPSEFFQTSVLGELEPFSSRGSAIGVNPFIKYPEARQFLLDLLAKCTPGVWFSTDSLIQYIKHNATYFLIPEKIPQDRWGNTTRRHDYFYETENRWGYEKDTIPENAPDAFERVEGRYIERFLENIPLIMRFVDVAYNPEPHQGLFPSLGMLKAFRVNERLQRLLNGEEAAPHVTVQPNFDVLVTSEFYPAKIIRQIAALGEQMSSPSTGGAYVGIFRLTKACVAAEQIRQPTITGGRK
jgi:hypothetical protein